MKKAKTIRSSYAEIDDIKSSRDKYLGLKEEAQKNLKAIESKCDSTKFQNQ